MVHLHMPDLSVDWTQEHCASTWSCSHTPPSPASPPPSPPLPPSQSELYGVRTQEAEALRAKAALEMDMDVVLAAKRALEFSEARLKEEVGGGEGVCAYMCVCVVLWWW